ncbi:TlpA family protein disulfide reductase [Lacinutrix sp. C3R15]|uniref:TlpA disulfide reductase family protein n=1 Tax=Flavobacteriaceae TaxID=49546 RepID=UPI001C0A5209|nr:MULTISPECIES: TlpA disulfide reductase family protein [Flavobacteriaceae]MBU2938785.1 TlpA family protein disulfide reductase [Lacinutrix sp. C3R15]MDO6622098.1 TlpA disulfide reductase family protein [Oceanihabitans sp. 1_MG-2023]
MYKLILVLLIALCFSCNPKKDITLEKGSYRAELQINDSVVLPFTFKVLNATHLEIYNAEEVIKVDEITYKQDSVFIKTPVFQGYLVAKLNSKNALVGNFIKTDLNRVVPFTAFKEETRFTTNKNPESIISGNWETIFSPENKEDKYIAKGSFKQTGNKVTGTFLTTTGDYRYLEGVVDGDQMKLSTFDGAHAFLFTARVTDSTMIGTFYSGNHWKEPFIATRNDTYELPDANSLTFLKEGYDKIAFSFPDGAGNMVSLEDTRFKDKVVLVQIMGTWCPNCLDETKYFSEYYKANKEKGLEIVALAFEYVRTNDDAFKNINRLKKRIGIEYPILLAQTGSSSKAEAQQKLPMLNHVLSYPTTIFIDKTGKVRKIHTGFNGPATGEKFITFKTDFKTFVEGLLNE